MAANAPAKLRIPVAFLPQLAESASLLSRSFGSAVLLLLLDLDAWRSKTKKINWIPGDSFVLGALSIQLLGLVSQPIVNISDSERLQEDTLTILSIKIWSNRFMVLSGRAVSCVVIGNIVADVSRSRDRNVWSDMFALSISATGVLVHISYEIYLLRVFWNTELRSESDLHLRLYLATLKPELGFYSAINIIILVSILLLVLLLGCAVFASISIHEVVAPRIHMLLSRSVHQNPGSVVWWETVEEHAVRSWITARTHQPQYIIARSVLISSIGFLVTICVVLCLGFSIRGWITFREIVDPLDGIDWVRIIVVVVQWICILPGWAIVCWRWLTAVVYYPRRMGTKGLGLGAFFRVEDFWKTAILEMQEEFMELDGESIKRFSYLGRFLIMLLKKLRLYKFLAALLPLQIFLVLLSKTCWWISEMIFSNHYMRRLMMGQVCEVEFSEVYNLHSSRGVRKPETPGDFEKYSDFVMHMPEENPAGVWMANRQSIWEMKARLEKGEYDGKNCKALISLLEKTGIQNLSSTDFNIGTSSSKIMVVSQLTIIIELSAFYQGSGGFFAGPPTDTVNDCIQACSEAWKFIELVENSDPEAVLVSKKADKLFHGLKQSREWFGLALPINNFEARTVEAAKRALQGLADKGRQIANTGSESKNWNTEIAGNSLYKVCESMKDHSVNVEELLYGIQSSLADVIGSCMFKTGEIIMNECKLWAQAFIEEKIWDALYEAGRAKGVTEELRRRQLERIKFGRQLNKLHSL